VMTVGKVLLGTIYDKKGIKFGVFYCMIGFVAGVVLLTYAQYPYMAAAFALVFSLANSTTTVTPPHVTAQIVGEKDYSVIFGVVSLFYGAGAAIGPAVAALVYVHGLPDLIWIAFAALSVVAAFTMILAVEKGKGLSRAAEAEPGKNMAIGV